MIHLPDRSLAHDARLGLPGRAWVLYHYGYGQLDMRRCLRTSIWLLLVFLLVPSPARANFGITTEGGQLVAEPIGGTGVVIRQESLTLDLRPLAEGDLAHIEASYRLHNPGPEMRHDLVFVSGSPGVTGFLVTLDGQSVASYAVQGFVVPDAWKVPDKTPNMRGGFDSYDPEDSKEPPVALACAVVLAPGAHELSVRYDAEAMVNHRSMPIVSRQFVYLLSPARSWANFKKLDVVVLLPSGWLAASLPVLTREGDTLLGSFDGLPSDAIALTVQAPEGWWHRILAEASLYVVPGVVAAGIPFCVLRGRACGRRRGHDLLCVRSRPDPARASNECAPARCAAVPHPPSPGRAGDSAHRVRRHPGDGGRGAPSALSPGTLSPGALTRGAPAHKIDPAFAMTHALVVGAGVTGCSE